MNDREVFELLQKIDDGYKAAKEERILLSKIEKIVWKNTELIPESISLLSGLEELDVSGFYYNKSELNSIPWTIKSLRNLSRLNLSNSKIDRIPVGIASLTSLQVLDLSNTEISGLSKNITNLRNLQILNLSETVIGELTSNFEKLVNLQVLNLSNTKLSELPVSIEKLKNLQSLDLSSTRISELPVSIGKLTKLKSLDLSCTKIRHLPASIVNLTNLQDLNLHATQIYGFPAGIEMLSRLQNLNLSHTKINGLTQKIGKLKSLQNLYLNNTNLNGLTTRIEKLERLQTLDLSYSKISDLPPNIGRLTSLQRLELSHTNISGLPASIGKLTSLQHLGLNHTNISGLSASIGKLSSLQSLDLSHTKISELPASTGKLTSLKELNLSNTKIRNLPEGVGEIRSLKRLILEDCLLDELPEGLLALKLEFKGIKCTPNENEPGIFIWNLQLKNQPIEIFSQNYDLIVEYYKSNKASKPINECKVVFLGDGGAGKSLIIHRLINDGVITNEFNGESTPGICISSKKYFICNEELELHFWDFGGQAIMHSMHRLFLTNRTLYVVVVNARDNKANEQAWYWIRNIKSFANGAPVYLLVNQKDQNPSANVNENGLRKEYPDLKQVRVVSALKDTKEEFDTDVRDVICNTVFSMETVHTPFSASWLSLMNDLQDMPEDYITSEEFYTKCSKNLVETDKRLLDKIISWYQDLGVCFYSKAHPVSAQYMVLKPRWLLNALYILIFNGRKYAVNGIIPESAIYTLICEKVPDDAVKKVWSDITYKPEEIQYITNVLLNFELIYRIDNNRFFIPMLCDENEPKKIDAFDSEGIFHVSFKYKYLPDNVLHRLMVRHGYELNTDNVWRTGALFERKQCGWRSLVRIKDNNIDVYVKTENQKEHPVNSYLDMIRGSVYIINDEIGLTADEYIAYRRDEKEEYFKYSKLVGIKKAKRHDIYSEVFDDFIDIDEILGTLKSPEILSDVDLDSPMAALLNTLMEALHKLQGNIAFYDANENECNSYIRDLLEMRGYTCKDQTLYGRSSIGKSNGELDILIRDKDRNTNLSIYEALKLKAFGKVERDKLSEHLFRLLDNYNPEGFTNLFLTSYVSWSKELFNSYVDDYYKYVQKNVDAKFQYTNSSIIESYSSSFGRCFKICYDCGGITMNVYHIIMRVAK